MMGRGGDKAARQDMFPTKVEEWQTEERVGSPPIGTGSAFDVVGNPIAAHLRELGALRDANPALSTGASIVRVAQEGVLALSRIDRMRGASTSSSSTRARIRRASPSRRRRRRRVGCAARRRDRRDERRRRPRLGHRSRALGGPAPCGCRAAEARRREGDARSGRTRSARFSASRRRLRRSTRSRDVRGQARRAGAVDAARRGRLGAVAVYLDPRRYRKGERISLVAVVRASDGSVSTSPVLSARCLADGRPADVTTALDATGRRFAFRPAAILGNGSLLVTVSERGEIERLFWPNVDHGQHLGELRLGLELDRTRRLARRRSVQRGSRPISTVVRARTTAELAAPRSR